MPFPPAPEPAKKSSLLSFKNLKKLRWPALVAAATGGPYAYFEGGDVSGELTKAIGALTAAGEKTASSAGKQLSGTNTDRLGGLSSGVGGALPSPQLSEVFRFDITPAWVTSRWNEVTLGMADVGLSGHRVLLVTGPRPEDLAGSLTYYFDGDQVLKRIRFEGVTGDPRPLVAAMAMQYQFVRCRTDVPGTEIYQVHRDGKARGDLRVRSAPVVRATSQLGRYSVSLAIDNPRG